MLLLRLMNLMERVEKLISKMSMVQTSVFNRTEQSNFSEERERSSFIVPGQRDSGTSSKSCHGTGRDSQNSGRDRPGQPKSGTGRGTKRDRAENDVLKQENYVLKQKTMFYNMKGCSKTGK